MRPLLAEQESPSQEQAEASDIFWRTAKQIAHIVPAVHTGVVEAVHTGVAEAVRTVVVEVGHIEVAEVGHIAGVEAAAEGLVVHIEETAAAVRHTEAEEVAAHIEGAAEEVAHIEGAAAVELHIAVAGAGHTAAAVEEAQSIAVAEGGVVHMQEPEHIAVVVREDIAQPFVELPEEGSPFEETHTAAARVVQSKLSK